MEMCSTLNKAVKYFIKAVSSYIVHCQIIEPEYVTGLCLHIHARKGSSATRLESSIYVYVVHIEHQMYTS